MERDYEQPKHINSSTPMSIRYVVFFQATRLLAIRSGCGPSIGDTKQASARCQAADVDGAYCLAAHRSVIRCRAEVLLPRIHLDCFISLDECRVILHCGYCHSIAVFRNQSTIICELVASFASC